jgi:hypothetical protein
VTYALVGARTGDLLTYQGRPLVHGDRAEMEWLFPSSRVVAVSERDLQARSPLPPLPIREHPGLAHIEWPLTRDQFR